MTSTTLATSIIGPTVSRAIEPPNPYKYWWLRSPNTVWDDNYAHFVDPDGDVYDYNSYSVTRSYGRLLDSLFQIYPKYWWLRSPYTSNDHVAAIVRLSGDVYYSNVYDSYGRKSPVTELFNMQDSWHVSRYGDTDFIDAVYDDSYDNKNS